jgi:hypothetical protein
MYCGGLKTVMMPASIQDIGNGAFQLCDAITDVYYGSTEADWDALGWNGFDEEQTTIHFKDGLNGADDEESDFSGDSDDSDNNDDRGEKKDSKRKKDKSNEGGAIAAVAAGAGLLAILVFFFLKKLKLKA